MKTLFKTSGIQSFGVEQKKVNQKKQILKAIYFNGSLANSELARQLNLSTPKINSLLLELIEDGLVVDNGPGDSSGGRRPNIYGLVNDGFYVAGISIGIRHTTISVFNSNNIDISGPRVFPVNIHDGLQAFKSASDCLDTVLQQCGIERSKIIVGGVEMPGLVNIQEGRNRTHFPEVENLNIELAKVFEFPVFFENDSKIRTYAEQYFGLAKGRENVLMVLIDWGVGLGMILNGQLYTGKSGFAGEFGHLPIIDNGILCQCGKQGCLETIASATAIARLAKEGLLSGKSSLLHGLVEDIDKIETDTVIKAANAGDQFSISVLTNVAYWLGKGIAHLIQIFNPELIIIGGKVTGASQFMSAPIQQAIHTFSNHDISNDTEIKFSLLGPKAAVIGIAAYALDKLSNQ